MALFSNRSWDDWIKEYEEGHQHPINRKCHAVGIPLIVFSLLILPLSAFYTAAGFVSLVLFSLGWVFQFVGHYYEKKPPEFLKDWRFLFVGTRWWFKHLG